MFIWRSLIIICMMLPEGMLLKMQQHSVGDQVVPGKILLVQLLWSFLHLRLIFYPTKTLAKLISSAQKYNIAMICECRRRKGQGKSFALYDFWEISLHGLQPPLTKFPSFHNTISFHNLLRAHPTLANPHYYTSPQNTHSLMFSQITTASDYRYADSLSTHRQGRNGRYTQNLHDSLFPPQNIHRFPFHNSRTFPLQSLRSDRPRPTHNTWQSSPQKPPWRSPQTQSPRVWRST